MLCNTKLCILCIFTIFAVIFTSISREQVMEKAEKRQSFVFGVSVSDYNFIGREDEIRQLKMNFEEGINTILISPRRWGKTSLVKKYVRKWIRRKS